ncbi:MAG: alpha/beta fold hydrolase [SAR324 cluster bacterium]|nr:alpha/beta fold hydrolase [SAR324 cluster bacterium]
MVLPATRISQTETVDLQTQMEKNQFPALITPPVESGWNQFRRWFGKGVSWSISALNGLIGDYMHEQKNELTVTMGFYLHHQHIPMTGESLDNYSEAPSSRICVLIHGLSCNEDPWQFSDGSGDDYAKLLQRDSGYTPFYLRYNSGLHISHNGENLSALLDQLHRNYPVDLEEIVLIGHSMGGLVARSACHYGCEKQQEWTQKIKKILVLGSPHQGAPLEQVVNVTTHILDAIPTVYSRLASDFFKIRSAGIKDLRFGYITHEDWDGHHPDTLLKNTKTKPHLPENIELYVIYGVIHETREHLINEWFGDGMVLKRSAQGRSSNKEHCLSIPEERIHGFPGKGHLTLMNSREVYEVIHQWCTRDLETSSGVMDNNGSASPKTVPPIELKPEMLKGAVKLLNTGIEQGIQAFEKVHASIARTPYEILSMIPVVGIVSEVVREINQQSFQQTCQRIRDVNNIANEFVQQI